MEKELFSTLKFDEVKLSEVLEPSDERLGEREEPEILTCTEKAGLILQRQRFTKRVATTDTSNYKVVHLSDIVYNPYLLWAGSIDQCWIVDIGITSPAYEVFKIKSDFDRSLIGRLLKSDLMVKRYNGISIGTIQRRRRAPAEKFLDLIVSIPKIDNQAKLIKLTESIQSSIYECRQLQENLSKSLNILTDYWLQKQKE